jgi:hypothetical protein
MRDETRQCETRYDNARAKTMRTIQEVSSSRGIDVTSGYVFFILFDASRDPAQEHFPLRSKLPLPHEHEMPRAEGDAGPSGDWLLVLTSFWTIRQTWPSAQPS